MRTSTVFGLGTNAVVSIQQELTLGGYYLFLLKLPGIDRSKFKAENWPLEMRSSFYLLVKTNGQTVMETNVSAVRFDYISDERKELVYHITGLSLPEGVKMDCVIKDLGAQPQHPAEFVFVRAVSK